MAYVGGDGYKQKQMKIKKLRSSEGFTIIELMIALAILGTILVMSTVIMMHIGSMYTKGVNSSTLQNATRNISDDLTSAIQFSGKPPATCTGPTCTGTGAICIGTDRYSFQLGKELGLDASSNVTTSHVLWHDTMPSAGSCTPVDLAASTPSPNGYEMTPVHVRLNQFSATETSPGSNVFIVTVAAAYGDDDLFSPTPPHNCLGGSGTEYCGKSQITTTVTRRIQ